MSNSSNAPTRRVAVCSWSLRPASAAGLVDALQRCGLERIQLALEPLRSGAWPADEAIMRLADAGVEIISGMMSMSGEDYSTLETIRQSGGVRPDATWQRNLDAAGGNADLAARLGLKLVSFHAGFMPEALDSPLGRTLLERVGALADVFAQRGVSVALETGQETADTLLAALAALQRPCVGVNFDPANMILYGMGEPVQALRRLAPHVRQLHIKDALPTRTPGTWGQETPAGAGAVAWGALFDTLRELGLCGDLVIECEGGGERIANVLTAHQLILEHLQRTGAQA